jgi:hypothetical protein
MAAFYITALAAWIIAPTAKDYWAAVSICGGCLEAAPASLAASVCAGLIGDLMLRKRR